MYNSPAEAYQFLGRNLPQSVVVTGDPPTFYTGPLFPQEVRIQILHVLTAAVGSGDYADEGWRIVRYRYDYEMGTVKLGQPGGIPDEVACGQFIWHNGERETLDVIGLALHVAEWFGYRLDVGDRALWKMTMPVEEAVPEINRFLHQANLPWQFERGQWVQASSGYVHPRSRASCALL